MNPLTDIIRRNKANQPTEFGHKVWFDEVDGGLVSNYRVLVGNPPDEANGSLAWISTASNLANPPIRPVPTEAFTPPQMKPMPAKAASSGSSYPNLVTNQLLDDNTKNKLGSKEVAASTMASKGALVSANASTTSTAVLEHGQDGFERWVGWGVVAANLIVIGRTLATNHNSLVTVQPGRSIFNFFGLLQRFATEN